jgi:hypothetical protein
VVDADAFVKRIYNVFNDALGVPRDATVQEIEVDIDNVDDDVVGEADELDLDNMRVDL